MSSLRNFRLAFYAYAKRTERGFKAQIKTNDGSTTTSWECLHNHRLERAALWCARDKAYHELDLAFRVATAGLVILLVLAACAQPASAQITWSGPPLSPAEAADVLRRAPGLANLTGVGTYRPPDGPTFGTTGSRGPTAGPWDWPAPTAPRRLDGSPTWQPPAVYGLPYGDWMYRFGPFARSEGTAKGGRSGRKPPHPGLARRSQ